MFISLLTIFGCLTIATFEPTGTTAIFDTKQPSLTAKSTENEGWSLVTTRWLRREDSTRHKFHQINRRFRVSLIELRPPGFRFTDPTCLYRLWEAEVLINCPFATSAFPSQAVVCSVTAVLRQPLTASLHPPPAALRRRDPTSNARRSHNPKCTDSDSYPHNKKNLRTPNGVWRFFGCGGRT